MNLRNRISKILDLIDCRKSEASEIDLTMAGDRIVDDDRGYPILPPDPSPGEKLVWAEQTLMRCSFEDGLKGSPELEKQRALAERAGELRHSLIGG